MLNGIDVASYQTGLNPAVVPCDFVIVKSTQGTTYTNPDFKRMADATLKSGKLLGIYHYAAGDNPISEANFFIKAAKPYIGKAILALDWEKDQNKQFGRSDVSWCKTFLDHVREKTGIKPFIYMSKDMGCRAHNWSAVARSYPLWGAQYASMDPTGYQTKPWTSGTTWGVWNKVTIFQYSSRGRLAGWSKNLDLDLAYMTADEWRMHAGGRPLKDPFPDKSDSDLAVEILFNVHSTGDARKKKLGPRWYGAQEEVGRLLKSTPTLLVEIQKYLKKHGAEEIVK